MQNKRSIGVTFWAWAIIINFVWGESNHIINFQHRIQEYGAISFVFLILSIAFLICGIFLLKLNEHARKATIYLSFISIIVSIFYLLSPRGDINRYEENSYAKREKTIMEQVKPEYQKEALEKLNNSKLKFERFGPIFIVLLIIGGSLIPVYFFTRPSVKEQFLRNSLLRE